MLKRKKQVGWFSKKSMLWLETGENPFILKLGLTQWKMLNEEKRKSNYQGWAQPTIHLFFNKTMSRKVTV